MTIKKGDIVQIAHNYVTYIGQVIVADYDNHRKTHNIELDVRAGTALLRGYTYWKQFSEGGTVAYIGSGPTLSLDTGDIYPLVLIPYDVVRIDDDGDCVIVIHHVSYKARVTDPKKMAEALAFDAVRLEDVIRSML